MRIDESPVGREPERESAPYDLHAPPRPRVPRAVHRHGETVSLSVIGSGRRGLEGKSQIRNPKLEIRNPKQIRNPKKKTKRLSRQAFVMARVCGYLSQTRVSTSAWRLSLFVFFFGLR